MAWNEFFKAIHSRQYFEKTIPIIILGSLFNFFWGLVTPIFSIRINQITGSLFFSGIVLGIWGIIKFFMDIPSGTICSKFGSKKIIGIALMAYMIISFMYTVVNNTLALIILRIIHSVFGSLYWVSFWSLLRNVPKTYIEEEINLSTVIRNIALIIAPLIGSVIIVSFSWSAPFYVLSLSFIPMFLISRKIPESRKKDGRTIEVLVNGLRSFIKKGRKSLGVVLSILAYGTSSAFFSSFLPIIMNDLGYNVSQIGIVMAISTSLPWIIIPLLILDFIEKKGTKIPIVGGIIISSMGCILILMNQGFFHMFLSVLIIYTGFSMALPTANILVGQMADGKNIGEFSGVAQTFKDLSSFIGSFIGGFFLQFFSLQVFAIQSLILLFSAPIIYLLLR